MKVSLAFHGQTRHWGAGYCFIHQRISQIAVHVLTSLEKQLDPVSHTNACQHYLTTGTAIFNGRGLAEQHFNRLITL